MITIHPSVATLQLWSERMVPEHDVWYWDESLADIDIAAGELLGRREYLDHSTYSQIEYVNAYWHWRMPIGVQQVLISHQDWIDSLSNVERSRVLAAQVKLDRGMIFPRTHFDVIPHPLQSHVIGDKIVISRTAWMSMSPHDQFTALQREMLSWDDSDCFPVPAENPDHIRAIANTYSDEQGTNCLSTTAYCITGREEVRHTWMFQPEFLEILERQGFQTIDGTESSPGDVIAFIDSGTLVHAAYCVATDRFVNKNGQTMFNPVRMVNRAMLSTDWSGQDVVIYRQISS